VSGDKDGIIKVWNSLGVIWDLDGELSSSVNALLTLPNDNIVSGYNNGKMIVWNSTSGTYIRYINSHTSAIYALTILSNDDFVSGSGDIGENTIRVWNSNDGTCKLNITIQSYEVRALTTLSNDDIVSGGDGDYKIRVWNSTDGTLKFTLSSHEGNILNLATLSNGDIVSAGLDQTIRVWNLADKTPKLNITTASSPLALTILSDDDIVCGFFDGKINIYMSDGTLNKTLDATSKVNTLVSYSNNFLISGSDDDVVRIWTA
jgi:WD40 repeat protein